MPHNREAVRRAVIEVLIENSRVAGVLRQETGRARPFSSGLKMLRPRERRRPKMPNQLSQLVEERIVSFAIAHPGLGPKRVASELAHEKWGAIVVSPNGVWRVLCRHGLNMRAKRLALIASYRAPAP